MYNADQKAAFLSQFQNPSDSYKLFKNMFLSISGAEERAEKDVSLFDESELSEAFPSIAGLRYESSVAMLSQLKRYVKWCKDSGKPTSDSIFSYEPDLSAKIKMCYVRSPGHLLSVLDYVFAEADKDDIEYIYRTYLWLAYFGFMESEAADVVCSDVNFDRLTMKGKQIYRESLNDIRKACNLTEFKEFKRNLTFARAKGDRILRGKPTTKSLADALTTTYRQSVSKFVKKAEENLILSGNADPEEVGVQLSFKRVYMSGVFYRAHQAELLHEHVSFDNVVDERYERSKEKFSHAKNKINKTKYHMKLGYLEDYKAWKQAFRLQ